MYDAEINVVISNEPLYDKINQLKAQIATLNQTIVSLNEQIASKDIQISELTSQVSNLTTQVESLTAQVASLTTENAELRAVVEPLREQVATLTEQVSTLTAQVSTLTDENTQLTSQVSTLTAQVTELQTAVETLTQTVTSLTTKLNTINGEEVQNPADYLLETKSQILSALQSKGSSATSSTTFRNYATEINNMNVSPSGDEHTLLLLHLDSTNQLNDSSIYRRPISPIGTGTPTITTSESKFGNGSLYLNGTCGIYVNQTDFFPLSSAGWTFEFFYKPISWDYYTFYGIFSVDYTFNISGTNYRRYQRLASSYNYSARRLECCYLDLDNYSSGQTLTAISGENLFGSNAWHHLAWVKNPLDSTYLTRIYHNGQFVGWYSGTNYVGVKNYQLTPFEQIPSYCYFFCCYNPSISGVDGFNPCYVNEIRFSNVCRYTANFTPPTEPFSV